MDGRASARKKQHCLFGRIIGHALKDGPSRLGARYAQPQPHIGFRRPRITFALPICYAGPQTPPRSIVAVPEHCPAISQEAF